MRRSSLKSLIDAIPSPRVPAEMYTDPLLRSMHGVLDRTDNRLREDLLALYSNRALTDDGRSSGFEKAERRHDAGLAKFRSLEERFNREVWIPHMKRSGMLRDMPAKPGKRRA